MRMAMSRKSLISDGVVEIALGSSRSDGRRSLKIGSGSSRRSSIHPGSLSSTIAYVPFSYPFDLELMDRSNMIVCIIECSYSQSLIRKERASLANPVPSTRIDVSLVTWKGV
jgi:hypothetical protein